MGSHGLSLFTLTCVLVLLGVIGSSTAILPLEAVALANLLAAFPALSNVQRDPNVALMMNGTAKSWPSNFDTLCDNGDGYEIFGVRCAGGSIDAIFYTDAWGPWNQAEVLNGLSPLVNLRVFQTNAFHPKFASDCANLLLYLVHQTSLDTIILGSSIDDFLVPGTIGNQTQLKTLRVPYYSTRITSELSTLTNLTVLDVDCGGAICGNLTTFVGLSSLRWLRLGVNSRVADVNSLPYFPAIETLEFYGNPDYASFWPLVLKLPPTLKEFYLHDYPRDSLQCLVLSGVSPPSLEYLTVTGPYLTNITAIPPSVKKLVFGAMPSLRRLDFTFPPALQSFRLYSAPSIQYISPTLGQCTSLSNFDVFNLNFNWLYLLPNLNATSLNWVSFGETSVSNVADVQLDQLLCDSLPISKVQHLDLASLGFSNLPPCLSLYTNLTYFRVDSWFMPGPDVRDILTTQVFSKMPKSLARLAVSNLYLPGGVPTWYMDWNYFIPALPNLQLLWFRNAGLIGTFPNELVALSSLQSLDLSFNGFTGTIPHDFFFRLPQLNTFFVSTNAITGTFPWYGLENLVYIAAFGNDFNSWPSLLGNAAKLQTVDFAANNLTQIPNDESFLTAMPALQQIILSENLILKGRVPQFWATHPTLTTIQAAHCAFEGSLPSIIRAPSLQSVNFGKNRVCGLLPQPEAPVGMISLQLEENLLIGSIPNSWANLTIRGYFDLSSNYLTGTLPYRWISPISNSLSTIHLEDNLLHGNMPILDEYLSLYLFNVTGNSLDACLVNPHLNFPGLSCGIGTNVCDCSLYYMNCSATDLNCPITPPISAPVPTTPVPLPPPVSTPPCAQVAPRPGPPPIPVSPCPSLPPTGQFICVNGVWTSVGSVEQPEIVVSGGSQVVVSGNLTVTSTVTISGANTQIIVNGCLYIGPGGVVIQLTPEEVEQLVKTSGSAPKSFIEAQCGTDLGQVVVTTQIQGGKKTCKKYTSKNASTKESLAVVFSIDNSQCERNRNIAIAVPSVLGGVIILAAAGTVAYLVYRKRLFKPSV